MSNINIEFTGKKLAKSYILLDISPKLDNILRLPIVSLSIIKTKQKLTNWLLQNIYE